MLFNIRLSFYILHILEVVDQLSYIGTCFTFIFNYSNKFTKAKKQLSEQGQKALFAKLMKLELIDFIFTLDFLKILHNYPGTRRRNTSRSEHRSNKGVTSGRSNISIHFPLLRADEGVTL